MVPRRYVARAAAPAWSGGGRRSARAYAFCTLVHSDRAFRTSSSDVHEGPLRIRVSQPALVPDLAEFLGRAFCTTESVRGSVLEVTLPSAADGARARRELDLYLAAWRGLHPPVEATILDG